jgi:hypothetical protein
MEPKDSRIFQIKAETRESDGDALIIDLTKALIDIREEIAGVRKIRNGNGNGRSKFWLGILAFLVGVAIVGAHAKIWDLDNRQTRVEESRFTNIEGAAMEQRIMNAINGLPSPETRLELADHENRLRTLERKGGGG